MPAKSQKQQKLFNWVHAIQSGKAKGPKKIKNIAKSMKPNDVKHFMSNGPIDKELPEHVKKAFITGFMKRAAEKLGSTDNVEEKLLSHNLYKPIESNKIKANTGPQFTHPLIKIK